MFQISVVSLMLLCTIGWSYASVDSYHPELSSYTPRILRDYLRKNVVTTVSRDAENIHDLGEIDDDDMHPLLKTSKKPAGRSGNPAENSPEFWHQSAAAELSEALSIEKRNKNVAKNVILFLGDGMGVASITTGRILRGQNAGSSGEETKLTMDTFPHFGFSKTYNVDAQVADSAGTATAYMTGVKTDLGVLGYNAAITPGVCNTTYGNEVSTVLEDSHKLGKAVGVVTTTRLNHATPASAYAHSAYRYWYGDADLTEEARINGCKDIAYQLYNALPNIQVALGGGRRYFKPNGTKDDEYPTRDNYRNDGQDLIQKWKNNMVDLGRNAQYVWNSAQFHGVEASQVDHLWGMFEPGDMNYEVDRSSDGAGEPSLAEMTSKAIEILQKDDDGFFLLVEGGRIDHSHHGGNAYKALHEVLAFDDAIAKGVEMTSESDTLIVVTADHSHTFTFGGYTLRGNPLFGLARDDANPKDALDGRPYTSLNYGNGKGFQGGDSFSTGGSVVRENLTNVNTKSKDYLQQTGVPKSSETHGGEDVAIFARGPMAHLFHGVHEQSYIAHVMRYASCVGSNKLHCENQPSEEVVVPPEIVSFLGYNLSKSSAEGALYALFALEMVFSLVILAFSAFYFKRK